MIFTLGENNEIGSTKDNETGIILSEFKQCTQCGIRIVDESGYLELAKRNNPELDKLLKEQTQ